VHNFTVQIILQTIFENYKEKIFKINTIDYGNGYYGEEFKSIENRIFNP
jgi:hypothetical protein